MTDTTLIKRAHVLVPTLTSNAVGAITRAAVDLRTALGAVLTGRIINGATGPTKQCTCNVYIAHTDGDTPATTFEGDNWRLLCSLGGGGTTALKTTNFQALEIPASAQHLMVEFLGNTGQPVTVMASLSIVDKAVSA